MPPERVHGKGSPAAGFEDTFSHRAWRERKDERMGAIRQYRMHADVGRVTRDVVEEYKSVLVYAAYLLGHIDGMEKTVEELAPKAISTIERHAYFKPFFAKLHAELRTMHGRYGHWQSLEVFQPLKQLAGDILLVGGIEIQPRPDWDRSRRNTIHRGDDAESGRANGVSGDRKQCEHGIAAVTLTFWVSVVHGMKSSCIAVRGSNKHQPNWGETRTPNSNHRPKIE